MPVVAAVPRTCTARNSLIWRANVGNGSQRALRSLALLGSVVWGVVELVALQRSRLRAKLSRA